MKCVIYPGRNTRPDESTCTGGITGPAKILALSGLLLVSACDQTPNAELTSSLPTNKKDNIDKADGLPRQSTSNTLTDSVKIPLFPGMQIDSDSSVPGVSNRIASDLHSTVYYSSASFGQVQAFYQQNLPAEHWRRMNIPLPDRRTTLFILTGTGSYKTIQLIESPENSGTRMQIVTSNE